MTTAFALFWLATLLSTPKIVGAFFLSCLHYRIVNRSKFFFVRIAIPISQIKTCNHELRKQRVCHKVIRYRK